MSITKILSRGLGTGVGGKVLQVVTATDSTQRTSTSASFVTGSNTLSVSITPASASNKILILAHSALFIGSNTEGQVTIFRGATNLGESTYGFAVARDGNVAAMQNMGINFLDSPNTTSATTYQVYFKSNGSTTFNLNRNGATGVITCLEIAG